MTPSSSAAPQPPRVFGGWQRDRSTFMYGLTPARAALLLTALVLASLPISLQSIAAGVLLWPVSVLLVALTFARYAGRTANEWITDMTRFSTARLRRQTRFLSGAAAPRSRTDPAGPAPMDLPGTLAPLRFLAAETGVGDEVAVIHHPFDQTYAVVARVVGSGLGLADSQRTENRVAAWGAALAGMCSEANAFVRIQVTVRTMPGDVTELHRWHTDHLAPDTFTTPAQPTGPFGHGQHEHGGQVGADADLAAARRAGMATAVANVEAVLASAKATGAQHESWLTFVMSATRARSDIRSAGDGDAAACAVLWRKVSAMQETLRQAGLVVEAWLDTRALAEAVRTGFDPEAVSDLTARRLAAQQATDRGDSPGLPAGVDPALAGPAAADNTWRSYRHDGSVSVSWVVHDWPGSRVYPNFLTPLLAHGGAVGSRRSLGLHYEPLAPRAAARKIALEATKADTALAVNAKTGKVSSAQERAARTRIDVQDQETASGHGLVRFMGYLTVTVADPADLPRAVASVEADAALCRVEIRRMFAQQDVGFFAAVLPVGQGLPLTRMAV